MKVIRNLESLPAPERASVLTIGNFDGVHRAHQRLISSVVEAARAGGAAAVVVTFDPHPLRVLVPDRAPKMLTPFEVKASLIAALGVDILLVLPFTRELSRLSPSQFVSEILVEALHAAVVQVGPTFRFGHEQQGTVEALAQLGMQEGFQLDVLPMLKYRGEAVSSSRIRQMIEEGRVARAARLLGRPFSNSGKVVAGIGVGRSQTVPTLNLAPVEEQIPKIGVYVSRTGVGATWLPSVTNVGHKPTFGNYPVTVESFLLDFSGEIGEREMEVEYLYRLRDEMKFPSPAALKAQIGRDAARARRYFQLARFFSNRRDSQLTADR
ncbi:MAG: bifunctional riboflavin kinase/FMN adenylyltransferase [Acidobacteria bacterium]|nr:MAG: bifunctional riboflavin kinase/FMN adenylyltransferase [Acidobacteriota bacterium]